MPTMRTASATRLFPTHTNLSPSRTFSDFIGIWYTAATRASVYYAREGKERELSYSSC